MQCGLIANEIMYCRDGTIISTGGHSGNGAGLNNPMMQTEHNVGPLPRGRYTFGPWQDSHTHLGPNVSALTPRPDASGSFDWLSGRGGFYCHGPEFSEGCIIQPPDIRAKMKAVMESTGDRELEVIE